MNQNHSSLDRREILRDLIERRRPVAESAVALRRFSWDEDELVELDASDVRTALAAFEAGTLSAVELRAWAEAIEVREDVGRTPGQEQLLNDALMALATPELFGGFGEAVATVRVSLDEQ